MTQNAQNTASPSSLTTAIARACDEQSAGQSYGALSLLLKAEFGAARERALGASRNGEIIGNRLSAFANSVIRALHDQAWARAPRAGEGVAICAVGGFGRDCLAPYSDIDLLFLHQFKDENRIKPFLDFILYPLFDAGAILGHSVHTPQSAIAFAKEDMTARTSYLDARLIAGNKKTFKDFSGRFDRLRLTTKTPFIKAKLVEQEARHDRSDQSRYLAEPDVKEGKGGLRDLHTLRWLYRYAYDGEIDDPSPKKKILTPADVKAFQKAERFLWSVRCQLHALRGRADERLTFDVQPAMAERLRYRTGAATAPVERFMKHYFLNATEVGRLTRIFCAKLEEEQNRLKPRAPTLPPAALAEDEAPGKPNLRIKNGRLAFQSPAAARKNPRDFFRLFRAFAKKPRLDFSPDALALITQNAAAITTEVRRDRINTRLFLASVTTARDPVKMLRVMGETGLLVKMLPFFATISGKVQYGLYRRYTIDEHVFQAVGVLTDIRAGKSGDEHPITSALMKTEKRPEVIYLTLLLYESRHSIADFTVEKSERLIRRVASRFLDDESEIEDVVWAVSRFGQMIEVAKRRNLSDTQIIKRFTEETRTQRRLDLSLILSVCHLRVVGAHTWDKWTRRQLADVYEAASAWLNDGARGVEAWLAGRTDAVRREAATNLAHWFDAERDTFLEQAPTDIVRALDAAQLAQFASLSRAAQLEGADAAVDAQLKDGVIEAMVYAHDRPGLLADLAGAIAGAGASVRAVQVLTTADDRALDIFTIQARDGAPIEEPDLVRRLHQALLTVARAAPKKPPNLARRLGDRRKIFDVPSEVRLDLEASEECVVVEAEGRDRPGLLYQLAAALNEIGVTIKSAHIATYGERAVDTFYLQDAPGYKITNKRRLQSIERRLMNVLNAKD